MNPIMNPRFLFLIFATLFAAVLPVHGQLFTVSPLDGVTWSPPAWEEDPGKSNFDNLIDLLETLEASVEEVEELWFLKMHFEGIRRLAQVYPPSDSQASDLIETFTDPQRGASLSAYINGKRELIFAYESDAGGVLSYVRYALPLRWNPNAMYPLYVWARGGGSRPYPADVAGSDGVYDDQIKDRVILGTPSGHFAHGLTIQPGALGGRGYTGDEEVDFLHGLDLFRSMFRTDPRRYYFGGFSNGGKAAYLIGARTVDRYHWAALGMCAPAIRQNLNADYAAPLAGTPIWIGVGQNDSLLQTARDLRDVLTDLDSPPEHYEEVANLGHMWTWEFQTSMYDFFNLREYVAPGGPPPAPQNLRIQTATPTAVTIAWDLPPELADAQVSVQWAVGSTANFRTTPRYIAPAGATSYTDTGLAPGQTYRFRLWAYDETGDSDYSNEIEVTVPEQSGELWDIYPKDEEGNVDTGEFLGWINVEEGDWIWSWRFHSWLYLPESFVEPSGAWSFLPR